MLNALTIDIEDYFQVYAFSNVIKYEDWDKFACRIERNTDHILQVLDGSFPIPHSAIRIPIRATFFVLGWLAERYPDLIRRIKKEGHEVACHGYAHQLIYTQSRDEFRQDIKRAKAILEDITGDEVIGYRAPSYSITEKSKWAFEVLVKEGFKYDSSIFPIRHDFYGMPSAPRFPFVISLNGDENFEFSVLNYESKTIQNSALINQTSELITQNLDLGTQSSVLQTNSTFKTHNFEFGTPHSAFSLGDSASTLKRPAGTKPFSEVRSAPLTSNTLLEFPISTVKFLAKTFQFPVAAISDYSLILLLKNASKELTKKRINLLYFMFIHGKSILNSLVSTAFLPDPNSATM